MYAPRPTKADAPVLVRGVSACVGGEEKTGHEEGKGEGFTSQTAGEAVVIGVGLVVCENRRKLFGLGELIEV